MAPCSCVGHPWRARVQRLVLDDNFSNFIVTVLVVNTVVLAVGKGRKHFICAVSKYVEWYVSDRCTSYVQHTAWTAVEIPTLDHVVLLFYGDGSPPAFHTSTGICRKRTKSEVSADGVVIV